jgi:group I intron endonuclease
MALSLFGVTGPWQRLPRESGIYEIVHIATGRVYVGSARNISTRIRKHCNALAVGRHANPHLQAAWRLYGAEAFRFSVIELVSADRLIASEQAHIDRLSAADHQHGFNILPNARSPIGRRLTDAQRQHLSVVAKRRPPMSAVTRARIGAAFRGVKRDPAIGKRVGVAQRGKAISPDQRAKIAAALRGRRLTEEHRAKISSAGVGRQRTPESIEKSAAAHRGRKRSLETCARIAAAGRGRTASLQARAHMADSQRARWATP